MSLKKRLQASVEEEEKLPEAETVHQEVDRGGDQGEEHQEGGVQDESGRRLSRRLPSPLSRFQSGQQFFEAVLTAISQFRGQ